MVVYTLIICLLGAGLIGGAFIYFRTSFKSSMSSETGDIATQIRTIEKDLSEAIKYVQRYASKAQYDRLVGLLDQSTTDLENEKNTLKEIEGKLDRAQLDVEKKEGEQQELKAAKEEEEMQLEELMESFSQISEESMQLEQKLAHSLDSLESMMKDLKLTEDQKNALDQLQEAITSAAGLFRDLIMEYQNVKERLDMLREQFEDLEDEYTRLVEQQLGE